MLYIVTDSSKFVHQSINSRQIKLSQYDDDQDAITAIDTHIEHDAHTARSNSYPNKNMATVAEQSLTNNSVSSTEVGGIKKLTADDVAKQRVDLFRKVEKRNAERLSRIDDACKTIGSYWRKFMPQAEFYHSSQHHLLYCKVAKGGCTFWEQLYSFILRPENMKKEKYSTLYEIPRWRIHFDRNITPPALFWSKAEPLLHKEETRFMFTRDPFSRIWSAYVDKIWLPDFWYWMRIKNHTTLTYKDRCLYDVTFADFVEYISSRSNSNKHWAPVHQSCNPCVFKPHILGNMSTFAEDAKHILSKGNLEYVLSQYNYKMRVRNELKMLVQYNYERLSNKTRLYKFCEFYPSVLAYRLWKTFQVNGYISRYIPFPNDLKSFDERTVLDAILQVALQHPLSHEQSSSQRKYFLRQAYQSVPRSIMDNMIARFEPDFLLFGFDRNPSFLLKEGEHPKPLELQ